MFPTRLQVKQRYLQLVDDPGGAVFTDDPNPNGTPSIFQAAFAEGYDIIFSAFLNQQVPRVEQVVQGIIVPPSPVNFSLTPAQMGIADFADFEWLSERTAGSSDKFIDLVDEDRLTQRAVVDRLLEFVWQNNAFQFVGCSSPRELQMKYVSSGEAPTLDATVIGIDSSLVFLSNYAAGCSAQKKGYDEIGTRCKGLAVGPKFDLGIIGGELFRLTQPLVRSRQNVVVAHKPYSVERRVMGRWRGIPYVASQQGTTGGGSQNVPVQYSSAGGTIIGTINGVNATFWLPVPQINFSLYKNGVLQSLNVDYTAINNQFTFVAGAIPVAGDLLTVEGYPSY